MRYVMKDKPNFLTSAAVIGVEVLKLIFSTVYILFVERRGLSSIVTYLREDYRGSLLLSVPAAAYSLQMSLEYVALANLDAAVFSAVVQLKLLATASFAFVVLRRKLKRIQILSLVLLTAGVMLCNFSKMANIGGEVGKDEETKLREQIRGVTATMGIAMSSGFASVYTEKVIKRKKLSSQHERDYGLAYTQIQLAVVSLIIIGAYAFIMDFKAIMEHVRKNCPLKRCRFKLHFIKHFSSAGIPSFLIYYLSFSGLVPQLQWPCIRQHSQ